MSEQAFYFQSAGKNVPCYPASGFIKVIRQPPADSEQIQISYQIRAGLYNKRSIFRYACFDGHAPLLKNKRYGCFNIRMQSPKSQTLTHFTDQPGTSPVRSWSDLSGTFQDAGSPSGLSILQYKGNPDYPGPWVEYPNLAWVQPAFPAHGTRYPLLKGHPLVLRYRLVVHNGSKPDTTVTAGWWDEYNQPSK